MTTEEWQKKQQVSAQFSNGTVKKFTKETKPSIEEISKHKEAFHEFLEEPAYEGSLQQAIDREPAAPEGAPLPILIVPTKLDQLEERVADLETKNTFISIILVTFFALLVILWLLSPIL